MRKMRTKHTGEQSWEQEELQKFKNSVSSTLKDWQDNGTNLAFAEQQFLADVANRDGICYAASQLRSWLFKKKLLPSAMDVQQRQEKGRVLKKLRAGLSDLAALDKSTAPQADFEGFRPWVTMDDVRKVLDLADLCAVVKYSVDLFGRDYADEILKTLDTHYRSQHEEVIVQRSLYTTYSPYGRTTERRPTA